MGSPATFGLHQHQRGTAGEMNLPCVPKISLFFLYSILPGLREITLALKGSCPRALNQASCTEREVTSCSPRHLSAIFNQTFASVISLLWSSPVRGDAAKWHLRTLEEETG